MGSNTSNLNHYKPSVGEDGWGSLVNVNWDTLDDALLHNGTPMTTGSIPFIGAGGTMLEDNSNFFWDDVNNRLGIGTNTLGATVHIQENTVSATAFIVLAGAQARWQIVAAGNPTSRFIIHARNTSGTVLITLDPSDDCYFNMDGNMGIGATSPVAKLHVDQASTTGAIPVLTLDQGDIDDTFINLIGTSAADGTRSISSDTTEDSAKFGAIRVEINGVTKWLRIYDDES